MAFKNLIAFGAGEITPELSERGNLEKFRTGLQTLRNCTVTKMGGLRNRPGTVRASINVEDYNTKFHIVKNRAFMFEFAKTTLTVHTDFNNKKYKFDDFVISIYPTSLGVGGAPFEYSESDLEILNFTNNDTHLFVLCAGKMTLKVSLDDPFLIEVIQTYSLDLNQFTLGSSSTDTAGWTAPTGYPVEYAYTFAKDGVESFTFADLWLFGSTTKLPIATNEANNLYFAVPNKVPPGYTVDSVAPDEVRFYRRPKQTGAWGFIGLASPVTVANGSPPPTAYITYKVIDFGQDADYTNQPPDFVTGLVKDTGVQLFPTNSPPSTMTPHTGLIYQNRLMIPGVKSKNLVFGSRTDNPTVFTRDFPLQDDSAVAFKTGSDGGAQVGRFFDGRGLVVTTSVGIYETPSDVLKPDTAYAIKRSNIVHDPIIPVLGLGQSFFVVDRRNEGVFTLKPAGDDFSFVQNEISIFSAHLLKGRRVVSWDVQDNGGQIIWMVLDDGTLLSLAYQEDQQLQAWSRNDTDGKILQVMVLKQPNVKDIVLMSVERTSADYTLVMTETLTDRNADFYDYVGSDGSVIYKNQMVEDGEKVTLTKTGADWSEVIVTYSGATPIWSNVDGLGAVGSVFRMFNKETRQNVDYQVTQYLTGPIRLKCVLISDIPPDEALPWPYPVPIAWDEWYQTWNEFDQLGPLEGKKVSVRLDGFTHASPLNTDPEKNYSQYTVTGGVITLDDGERGAIVSIGLPFAQDIQTLEVDTIEQSPVKLESQLVNKIHLSYFESRGVYASAVYPEDDTITGMENHETQFEPDEGIPPMMPPQPYTRREEMTVQGEYSVKGSVAIRNVDPQPIGLRAIILDEEIIGSGS